MADGFRVLITDRAWPDCQIERDVLLEVGAQLLEAPDSSEATLLELVSGVDALEIRLVRKYEGQQTVPLHVRFVHASEALGQDSSAP